VARCSSRQRQSTGSSSFRFDPLDALQPIFRRSEATEHLPRRISERLVTPASRATATELPLHRGQKPVYLLIFVVTER